MSSPTSETAFNTLLSELERSIDSINQEGVKAFQSGDYDKAKELTEKGKALSSLGMKLADLRKQWNQLLNDVMTFQGELFPIRKSQSNKTKSKKMRKGLRTNEDEYRVPILQALVELGGSNKLNAVIDRVGEIMKPILNKYDYMPLKSDPNILRWRNATQWVRYNLVQEGLMATDSPIGTWEISEKGRQWLKQQQEKA